MSIVLWIVAGLALLLAWSARGKLASVQESVDAARRDVSIREADLEELKGSVDGLRKLENLWSESRTLMQQIGAELPKSPRPPEHR